MTEVTSTRGRGGSVISCGNKDAGMKGEAYPSR